MNKTLLKGAWIGAALVAIPATIAGLYAGSREDLYIRIADDGPLAGTEQDNASAGPRSAAVVRLCGIAAFTHDAVRNDHTPSAFVKLSDTSVAQVNCLMGQARAKHLGIAVTSGIDTSEFYNLPGNPTAYSRCETLKLIAGTCELKKN